MKGNDRHLDPGRRRASGSACIIHSLCCPVSGRPARNLPGAIWAVTCLRDKAHCGFPWFWAA